MDPTSTITIEAPFTFMLRIGIVVLVAYGAWKAGQDKGYSDALRDIADRERRHSANSTDDESGPRD